MGKLFCFMLLLVCVSCSKNSKTDKYQNKSDKITNVHDEVREIDLKEVLISSRCRPYLMDDYLIICDYQSPDELKYIYLIKKLWLLTSTAYRGEGPSEIVNIGHIGVNESDRVFYISDHGRQKI